MKLRITFCFVLLLVFNSCKDDSGFPQQGLVTGPDFRYCACCGGYFIDITGKTYRFNNQELPVGSFNFDLVDTFPVKVLVVWKLKENSCLGDEITISKISVID